MQKECAKCHEKFDLSLLFDGICEKCIAMLNDLKSKNINDKTIKEDNDLIPFPNIDPKYQIYNYETKSKDFLLNIYKSSFNLCNNIIKKSINKNVNNDYSNYENISNYNSMYKYQLHNDNYEKFNLFGISFRISKDSDMVEYKCLYEKNVPVFGNPGHIREKHEYWTIAPIDKNEFMLLKKIYKKVNGDIELYNKQVVNLMKMKSIIKYNIFEFKPKDDIDKYLYLSSKQKLMLQKIMDDGERKIYVGINECETICMHIEIEIKNNDIRIFNKEITPQMVNYLLSISKIKNPIPERITIINNKALIACTESKYYILKKNFNIDKIKELPFIDSIIMS